MANEYKELRLNSIYTNWKFLIFMSVGKVIIVHYGELCQFYNSLPVRKSRCTEERAYIQSSRMETAA